MITLSTFPGAIKPVERKIGTFGSQTKRSGYSGEKTEMEQQMSQGSRIKVHARKGSSGAPMQKMAYWAQKWEKLGDGVLKTFLIFQFPDGLFHLFQDSWCQTNQLMQQFPWDFSFCDTCQDSASQSVLDSLILARNIPLSAPPYAMGCPWHAVGFRPSEDCAAPGRVRMWPQCQGHLTLLVVKSSFWFHPFIFCRYSISKVLLLWCMALAFWIS